jgi:hypothetical protein
MASVVPNKDIDAVQFFEDHLSPWSTNAVAIGTTAGAITAFTPVVKAARDAYTAQQKAQQAAKNATTAWHNAVKAMREMGGDLIKTIKAFADSSGNPAVYTLAEIPMPAAPTPAPPPTQPTDFKVSLTGSGALELSWKCSNGASSTGAFFVVTRKLAGESAFTTVGNVGKKKFTDASITVGTTGATYLVQGFRGEQAGPVSLPFGVQFGVNAGGGNAQQLKMAA